MSQGDDKKTRRIDQTKSGEDDPTIASTRAEGTGGSSSTDVNQPADRFTLTQVLGEGTQGEVCKAFDNLLHRHVAIKFPHRVGDDRVAQDILDEARKAARLNHPNVVTIYEVGFWKGRPFIAMELIEGVSLATILKECGRISVERFLKYARQILRALGAAHRSGLIHRDLKPHNVLLSGEGTLKLTDFGVAHVGSGMGADKTVQFKIAGTPAYMAPEQWSGLTPDARSDIYAFGCMAYKLLSGQSVFPAEDTMRHHLESKPKSLRSLAPNVPEALERILMRCLEKKPENRFQSCKELLDAMELAARSGGKGSGTASFPIEDRPARKAAPLVLISALVVVAGFAAFLFLVPQGKDLRGRIEASLGLGGERPEPAPNEEPEPGPGGGNEEQGTNDPDEVDRNAAELAARREEGLQALEAAKALRGSPSVTALDERIALARSAAEKLAGSPEAAEARRIITETETAKSKLTEKMKVEDFQKLLARAKAELEVGRIDEAKAAIREAEDQKDREAVLRQFGNDLNLTKLPLIQRLADDAARAGRFDEASMRYDEAANLADLLGRSTTRDEHRRDARTLKTLDTLARNGSEQPRYVLVTLETMDRDLERFPAARLDQARAWLSLGGFDNCRAAIESLLQTSPEAGVAAEARRLLALLPK